MYGKFLPPKAMLTSENIPCLREKVNCEAQGDFLVSPFGTQPFVLLVPFSKNREGKTTALKVGSGTPFQKGLYKRPSLTLERGYGSGFSPVISSTKHNPAVDNWIVPFVL